MTTVEKLMTVQEKETFEESVTKIRSLLFNLNFYLKEDGDEEALLLHIDKAVKRSLKINMEYLIKKLNELS